MSEAERKVVLIVEDVIDMAEFMMLGLEAIGIEAHHTYNAQKAIEFIQQKQPDLIILDIGLPEVSGWQLLEFINEWRKEKGIRIVIASAYTDPANRLVGKLQEIDAYLRKPFEMHELHSTVRRLLEPTEDDA